MIGFLKKKIAEQIGKRVGLTEEEIKDIWKISQSDFKLEVTIDAIAATFGIAGIIAELAEMGIDFLICLKIWEYFNSEVEMTAFIEVAKKIFSNKTIMLFYPASSITKNLVGKAISIPIATHILSGTINSVQTIALIMIWAKICKEQGENLRGIEIATSCTPEVAY